MEKLLTELCDAIEELFDEMERLEDLPKYSDHVEAVLDVIENTEPGQWSPAVKYVCVSCGSVIDRVSVHVDDSVYCLDCAGQKYSMRGKIKVRGVDDKTHKINVDDIDHIAPQTNSTMIYCFGRPYKEVWDSMESLYNKIKEASPDKKIKRNHYVTFSLNSTAQR